jgi:hypothetical protein
MRFLSCTARTPVTILTELSHLGLQQERLSGSSHLVYLRNVTFGPELRTVRWFEIQNLFSKDGRIYKNVTVRPHGVACVRNPVVSSETQGKTSFGVQMERVEVKRNTFRVLNQIVLKYAQLVARVCWFPASLTLPL